MDFVRPWFLILLPLAVLPLVWRRRGAVRYSSFVILPPDRLSRMLELAERGLAVAFLAATVVALSEPRTGERTVVRWTEGARLVFVLDQSASMFSPWSGAGDVRVKKLAVAKQTIGRFVEERPGDQLALIGFGKATILYTPPTFDHRRFLRTLELLNTDMGDTLIDIALLRALKLLGADDEDGAETEGGAGSGAGGAGSRAVVLVSDGAGRVLVPEEIARRYRRAGVTVYWIVIGGGESGDERMERLMNALGSHGRTFLVGEVNELPRALESIGRLEDRLVRVEEHRPGRTWTRLMRLTALGSLLALGVFALAERNAPQGGDRG